jgi:hypothetical protein
LTSSAVAETGKRPSARVWLAPGFLILLALGAFGIGLNTALAPFKAQAAAVAALSGKLYADVQLSSFARHPLLIRSHAVMGSAFVLIAAFQFWPQFRARRPRAHRIMGYVALGLLVLLPITGVAASIVYPFAGFPGVVPNLFWGAIILTCVVRSWRAIRRRDIVMHEAWVTRAAAMTVGITLSRIYEPLLVQVAHMEPHAAVALVFWLGQGEGLLAAELWLRRPGAPLARRLARAAAAR